MLKKMSEFFKEKPVPKMNPEDLTVEMIRGIGEKYIKKYSISPSNSLIDKTISKINETLFPHEHFSQANELKEYKDKEDEDLSDNKSMSQRRWEFLLKIYRTLNNADRSQMANMIDDYFKKAFGCDLTKDRPDGKEQVHTYSPTEFVDIKLEPDMKKYYQNREFQTRKTYSLPSP